MGQASLWGILIIEREPPKLADLLGAVLVWLADAGGFAAFLMAIWLAALASSNVRRSATLREGLPVPAPWVALLAIVGIVLMAIGGIASWVPAGEPPPGMTADLLNPFPNPACLFLFAGGGFCCLLAAAWPFFSDLFRMSWGRVWALSKLSFQEAIRRRVLWGFLAFLLIFLFPVKWFFPIKLEDEIRTSITVTQTALTPLLLIAAGLLAALSLPADIENNSIHTILTKPVQRFEVVAGRFLGYATLMTGVLFALTGLSLFFLWSTRLHPDAVAESYKAREVIYGELKFGLDAGRIEFDPPTGDFKGDSVGREWEYRRYIAGGAKSPQRAVWQFFDAAELRRLLPPGYAEVAKLETESKSLAEQDRKLAELIQSESRTSTQAPREALRAAQESLDTLSAEVETYKKRLADIVKQSETAQAALEAARKKNDAALIKIHEAIVAARTQEAATTGSLLSKFEAEIPAARVRLDSAQAQLVAAEQQRAPRAAEQGELRKKIADIDARRRELLAKLPSIPVEFAFDIFRTTKGEENRGVDASFTFVTHQFDPDSKAKYQADFTESLGNAQPDRLADWAEADKLAYRYGCYRFKSKQISDYHTLSIEIPPGIIAKALEGAPSPFKPHLAIILKCDSATQYLGVAKHDLYLLAGEGNFAINYLKGALGLWLRLMIVIGLAVAASTYLSGLIAALATGFLFISGYLQDYIVDLARGTSVGGGPAESLARLVRGENLTTPLDPSPLANVAWATDSVFRFSLRRVLNLLPDVSQLDVSHYVAAGFNIPGTELLMYTIFVIGYLLPWTLLAYYLMRAREIAS